MKATILCAVLILAAIASMILLWARTAQVMRLKEENLALKETIKREQQYSEFGKRRVTVRKQLDGLSRQLDDTSLTIKSLMHLQDAADSTP